MVSEWETIPSRLSMTSSEPAKEEILERLVALERENEKLRWYERPHMPPSKEQSDEDQYLKESSSEWF